MVAQQNGAVYLKDYLPPNYLVEQVDLQFNLDWERTTVKTVQTLKLNPAKSAIRMLKLDGEDLKLISVAIDQRELSEDEYKLTEHSLELRDLPEQFKLTIVTEINPRMNKALSGLYQSGKILCTQNEAEGFRRITYFQDRPDVMARYTTKIIADKAQFPILLSNGNKIDGGELENGQHWALWQDPFNKPCYLYALVAGDLGMIRDTFTTKSNRQVALEIYCDHGSESRCYHAMESLKKSMRWDEERFGLEYDLDLYMIVAVDSFNAGAMENKGLNIFNSSLTLADAETATDSDFLAIEGVIGHEYFHNWTGNRITCRDWFQLTLKEGLTVFRDQLFSEDMNSKTVQRLMQVSRLRGAQFPEDAGPMSHPIKPKSYISIDNFYSATVYEKGAEVIRMVHTLLGESGFRKGMDKYFELYDGQAVTTEDFLHAMSVANGNFDLSHFSEWYHQSGTPVVTARWEYLAPTKTMRIHFSQQTPPTSGQEKKIPLLIPMKLGLVGPKGTELPLKLLGGSKGEQPLLSEGVLLLRAEEQFFDFLVESSDIVPSLNRDFAAPIKLQAEYRDNELAFLMENDANSFNRAEAATTLAQRMIERLIDQQIHQQEMKVESWYIDAYKKMITDAKLDPAVKASCLASPMESMILDRQKEMDYPKTIAAFDFFHHTLANKLKAELLALYHSLYFDKSYALDPASLAKRQLRGLLVSHLRHIADPSIDQLLYQQYLTANNMTDRMSALSALTHRFSAERDLALTDFYDRYKHNGLVVQKWLAVQASSSRADTLEQILKLSQHEAFDRTIPNMVRSLYGVFGRNSRFFHAADGSGYQFMADKIIELDPINPHVSAGMAQWFRNYLRLPARAKSLMEKELKRMVSVKGLSKNTYEIISKTLS